MTSVNKLVEKISTSAYHNGWDDRFHALNGDAEGQREHIVVKVMLVVSELSEALEELRAHREFGEVYYRSDGKPEGFGVEIADAVIRLFHICGMLGLNLESLISEKLEYNAGRGHLHGGKAL